MSAHTNGPWVAVVGEGIGTGQTAVCESGYEPSARSVVALCFGYERPLKEIEAHARLVAAAPDMRTALIEIATICTESAAATRKRMGTRVGNCAAEARLRYAERRFAAARGLAVDAAMLELKLQDIYRQAEEAAK